MGLQRAVAGHPDLLLPAACCPCLHPHSAHAHPTPPHALPPFTRCPCRATLTQRIYGTAWETPEQLKAYLDLKVEAARRDHRKLGQELDLFSMQETAGGVYDHAVLLAGEVGGWACTANQRQQVRWGSDHVVLLPGGVGWWACAACTRQQVEGWRECSAAGAGACGAHQLWSGEM